MSHNPFLKHLMELLGKIGDYNKPPSLWLVLGLTLIIGALIWWPTTWRVLRHVITIIHEGGHGFMAFITGRPLGGIKLHMDTSGVTTTYGTEGGLGRILTSFAGYPAAGTLGLGMAWVIAAGHAVATLWGLIAILLLVLVHIRNLFGLWSVLATFIVVALATWFLPDILQVIIATMVMLFLLLGGLKTGLELYVTWVRDKVRATDADTLASVALLPAIVWIFIFIALDALTCVTGAYLLIALP